MNYDVQIGNTICRGLSYRELISLSIEPTTFLRRDNGEWIQARNCVELTHVLARQEPDNPAGTQDYEFITPAVPEVGFSNQLPTPHIAEEEPEERIFIPTEEFFKCKQKRKAALIGVLTLGLAGLTLMGIGNTWRSNIFAGTSLSANAGLGFVLKCLSFCFLTALIAIPYFIYSVFALIYYSLRLNDLKR